MSKVVAKRWYAGFVGDKRVTAWDRRKDAVYSKMRAMRHRNGSLTVRGKVFVEKKGEGV